MQFSNFLKQSSQSHNCQIKQNTFIKIIMSIHCSSFSLFSNTITQSIPTLKQLNNLHLQILSIYSHYQRQEQNYQNIRFRLKQIIHEHQLKKYQRTDIQSELKIFQMEQKVKNNQIDIQVKLFLEQEYLQQMLGRFLQSNVLLEKIIGNGQQSNDSYTKKDKVKNAQKLLSYSQIKQAKLKQIKFEIAKQTHTNQNLQQQVQMLTEEYQCLQKYVNNLNINKRTQTTRKNIGQLTTRRRSVIEQLEEKKYYFEEELKIDLRQQQFDQDYLSQGFNVQQAQEKIDDFREQQSLEDQIQIMRKLIESKENILKSLMQNNTELGLRIKQFNAKQVYLQKKKNFLQNSKLKIIQKKYIKLLEQVKQLREMNRIKKQSQKQNEYLLLKQDNKNMITNRSIILGCLQSLNEAQILIDQQIQKKNMNMRRQKYEHNVL